jgi:hypothetical protein
VARDKLQVSVRGLLEEAFLGISVLNEEEELRNIARQKIRDNNVMEGKRKQHTEKKGRPAQQIVGSKTNHVEGT